MEVSGKVQKNIHWLRVPGGVVIKEEARDSVETAMNMREMISKTAAPVIEVDQHGHIDIYLYPGRDKVSKSLCLFAHLHC